MEDRMLRDSEVAEFFAVTRQTIWNWARKSDGFPQPVKIGGTARWKKSEIETYLEK